MKIINHSYINKTGDFLYRKKVVSRVDENFLKHYYTQLGVDYPKFHKMDSLSKSAFLGDHLLTDSYDIFVNREEQLQLIFANSSSSKETDLKFIESYKSNNNPSPSLFVYTLPNILTGEIAIKHKWFGENIFYILPKFDSDFFISQIEMSFLRGNEYCLCGWVEMNGSPNDECFMFVVVKSEVEKENSSNELNEILNNYRNE